MPGVLQIDRAEPRQRLTMPPVASRQHAVEHIDAARDFSRAYLHHLVRSGEMMGAMLLSTINLYYYQDLMRGMRAAIADRRFEDFRLQTKDGWARGDLPPV